MDPAGPYASKEPLPSNSQPPNHPQLPGHPRLPSHPQFPSHSQSPSDRFSGPPDRLSPGAGPASANGPGKPAVEDGLTAPGLSPELGGGPGLSEALPLASPAPDAVDPILPPPIEALQIDEMEPPQTGLPAMEPKGGAGRGMFRSPRVTRPAGSPRRANGGPEPAPRARAEEINPGSKVVPRVEAPPGDFFSVDVEIEAWFYVAQVSVPRWLDALPTTGGTAAQFLAATLRPPNKAFASVRELREHIMEACAAVMDEPGWVERWGFCAWSDGLGSPLQAFAVQTLLFFCLTTAVHRRTLLLDNGVAILGRVLEQIAALRWDVGLDLDDLAPGGAEAGGADGPGVVPRASHLARLFLLSRMAVLAAFGDSDSLKQTKATIHQKLGLPVEDSEPESASFASPINYAAFMDEIATRYPSYTQPEDVEHTLGARLRRMNGAGAKDGEARAGRYGRDAAADDPGYPQDPRDLFSPGTSAIPFVPHSIVEACAIFKSRVKLTPAILQLYNEYRDPNGELRDMVAGFRDLPAVRAGWQLYRHTLPFQKSLVRVVVDFALQDDRGPSPAVHAALSMLWHVLRWFECSHVLMFENLAALVFDCQFHLFAHMFCAKHPRIQQYVLEDFPISDFWVTAGRLKHYDGQPLGTDMGSTDLTINLYNEYNLQTFTHLMGICRVMTASKTKRLLVVSELPVDPYKVMFGIYEKYMWLQMLQYLKAQVPFTGRRWRYLNMEIISAIYLYVPSEIDDTWLSGSDLNATIKNAANEEESLRRMILAFNKKLTSAA